MKTVLSPHHVWDLFSRAEVLVSRQPSEDVCHQILIDIDKTSALLKDPNDASNFESQWRDFCPKIQPFADETTFKSYKKEIDLRLCKILDPESVEY